MMNWKINSKVLTLGCFLVASLSLIAQRQLQVFDADDQQPLSFVKVFPNVGEPFFTDIDGKASLGGSVSSVQLRISGHKDTVVQIGNEFPIIVYMQGLGKNLEEFVILPGVNPALRIIDNTIANRKKNHPLENDAFTYKSYSKFIFDLDSSSLQKINNSSASDSIDLDLVRFVKRQHLFMMESSSERKFIPPSRDREEIIAYKVSGLNNPVLSTFAQSMQTFHFYENQFEILGNKYLSPIAFGATKKYYYLIEDTTVVGNDTTFLISFRPRPNTNFEGLRGHLYINTNGFAIEKVIVEPAVSDDKLMYIKIVQEYKFIEGKKWFPVDLKTRIEARGMNLELSGSKGYLVGVGSTYIKDIVLNPEIKKSGFGNVALSTSKDAGNVKDEVWNEFRKDTLTSRESETYVVLDSVSKAENFDRKINGLMALATGKLRMGYVALPLDRLINYNLYEGFRLGAGLETSDLLMKNITVGGYFAYGFKDKGWKYGGYSKFDINKRYGVSFDVRYQQDVIARGFNTMKETSWDLTSSMVYTNFYQRFMDRQRLAEIGFTVAPLGNLTFHLLANYQRIEFTEGYQFQANADQVFSQVEQAEASFEMKWNIRQRIVILGDMRIAKPTNFPKLSAKVTQGFKGLGKSTFNYTRLFLAINEDVEGMRFGRVNIHLSGSITLGETPLLWKQGIVGTRDQWGVVTINSLETAIPGEFFHDRQAMLITRYSFPVINTKLKWFAPEFTIHHGIGYGDMNDQTLHRIGAEQMSFRTMDKGLFEGGLIVSGLINMKFVHLGLGLFYRYGEYSDSNVAKNLVPKISIKLKGFN